MLGRGSSRETLGPRSNTLLQIFTIHAPQSEKALGTVSDGPRAPTGDSAMRVSIFGLGYVGSVTAACLSSAGHEVWGVDISVDKVRTINTGRSPIGEAGLEKMIALGRQNGSLRATTDPYAAVRSTDVSLVCVGTPSNGKCSLNLKAITAVARGIG